MKRFTLFPLANVLALAISLAPGAASAQAADTLTISSTFNMDYLDGTVGPDLAEVFANGHEHTWTLTLYGTSQSHDTGLNPFGVTWYGTEIHATSFDFEFFGPDAATLNGIVSDHIAGGDVLIYLANEYSSGIGNDFSVMHVWPRGPDFGFASECDLFGCGTLFPTDADGYGYPVVGPDPFSILNEYSALFDRRPGNDGYVESRESLVTFEGSVSEPDQAGDFNGDGTVDGFDFLKWQRGESPDPLSVSDLADWEVNYGMVLPPPLSSISTAVPEPASIGLLLPLAAALLLFRRRSLGRPNQVSLSKDEPCD